MEPIGSRTETNVLSRRRSLSAHGLVVNAQVECFSEPGSKKKATLQRTEFPKRVVYVRVP